METPCFVSELHAGIVLIVVCYHAQTSRGVRMQWQPDEVDVSYSPQAGMGDLFNEFERNFQRS
jgi:hypothetical protein